MSACNIKSLLGGSVQVLLLTSLCLLGCSGDGSNNPLTPESLVGTWDLFSSMNKESQLVIPAGQRTDIGNGVFVTIMGGFVFTETTFTLTTNTTIEEPGEDPRIEMLTSIGSYSLVDDLIILTEGEDSIALMVSLSENRLILEDALERTILERR